MIRLMFGKAEPKVITPEAGRGEPSTRKLILYPETARSLLTPAAKGSNLGPDTCSSELPSPTGEGGRQGIREHSGPGGQCPPEQLQDTGLAGGHKRSRKWGQRLWPLSQPDNLQAQRTSSLLPQKERLR